MKTATKGVCQCFIYTIFYIPIRLRGVNVSHPRYHSQHTAVLSTVLALLQKFRGWWGRKDKERKRKENSIQICKEKIALHLFSTMWTLVEWARFSSHLGFSGITPDLCQWNWDQNKTNIFYVNISLLFCLCALQVWMYRHQSAWRNGVGDAVRN